MAWLKSKKLLSRFGINLNLAKMTIHNQVEFFSSINGFLKNGLPLSDALNFYGTLSNENQTVVHRIKESLLSGNSFSRSVRSLVSNDLYYQIRIAEYHGDLITALDKINEFLMIKKRQKEKLANLLAYPSLLLILLLGIIVAIHAFITPQLREATQTQGKDSHYVIWIWLGGIVMGGISLLMMKYRRMNRIDRINLMFRIPVLKQLYRYYYAYYLAGNLALMMRCGMDLRQIIDLMCQMKKNLVLVALGKEIKRLINYGGNGHDLKAKFQFVPLKMLILMDNGDAPQVLAQKLESYSTLCFDKLVRLSYRLIGLIQPVMFLVIGLVIVLTYLGMLLPMYNSIKGVY